MGRYSTVGYVRSATEYKKELIKFNYNRYLNQEDEDNKTEINKLIGSLEDIISMIDNISSRYCLDGYSFEHHNDRYFDYYYNKITQIAEKLDFHIEDSRTQLFISDDLAIRMKFYFGINGNQLVMILLLNIKSSNDQFNDVMTNDVNIVIGHIPTMIESELLNERES